MAKQPKAQPVSPAATAYVAPLGFASINKLQTRLAEIDRKLSAGDFLPSEKDELYANRKKWGATLDGLLKTSASYADQEAGGLIAAKDAEIVALRAHVATLQTALVNRDEQIAALNELITSPGPDAPAVSPAAADVNVTAVVNPAD